MNVDLRVFGGERLQTTGPLLIAPTHMGHVEPMLLSGEIERPIHWVARTGLFRIGWGWAMRFAGTIELNQHKVCTQTMRHCIQRLHQGRILGMFPEGKVTNSRTSVAFGGPIYGGTALISLRSGVPIVPIVVLGTDEMVTVESWFPGSRTRVAIGVGEPVVPPPLPARPLRRDARRALTEQLALGFQRTRRELSAAMEQPGKAVR